MKNLLAIFVAFFSIFNLACEEKKKEITQELCERQTNRADCEAAGCTYTCGIALTEEIWNETHRTCLARKRFGVCLAIVPYKAAVNNNNGPDVTWEIEPGEEVWIRRNGSQAVSENHYEYIFFHNATGQRVEAKGYTTLHFDPCLEDDPDETLFPWEGSCETDWWSETMWDDILTE